MSNHVDKNYRCMAIPVEPALLRSALEEWSSVHYDALYDISTSRERMSPALSRTRSYYLRVPNVPVAFIKTTTSTQDVLDCKDTELFDLFPTMRKLIENVGYILQSGWRRPLGRAFVTRLEADANIGRHIDEGEYFQSLHRVHLVLKSSGSTFCWDDSRAVLEEGRVYVVNNSIPHWVENSGTDRTHLIFDAA